MSTLTLPRFVLTALAVLCLLAPRGADAAPRLLFSPVAESEVEKELEAEVEQELLLALDRVVLESRALGAVGFTQMPLAEQLQLLEPWANEDDVLAVAWLAPSSDERLLLHLVLVAEGRTVLRVVEAASGPGGAGALALAAREVLSLLLVSRERAAQEVAPAAPEPSPEPVVDPPAQPLRRWSVHLLSGVGLRPSQSIGPPVLGQLQAGFAVDLVGRLSLAIDGVLMASGGAEAAMSFLSGGGGAQLRWLPGGEKLGAGPLFSVLLMGTRLQLPEGDGLSVQHFDLRFGPGFGLRVDPGAQLGLFLQASLDILPTLWEARRRSTDEVLFSSALLQARVVFGLRVQLPPVPHSSSSNE